MKRLRWQIVVLMLSALFGPPFFSIPLRAQAPVGSQNPCAPTAEEAAQALDRLASRTAGQAQLRNLEQHTPRDVTVTAIPGIVAAGAKWTKIWQEGGNSADGIIAEKDGTVLVAQEDYDAVLRIYPDGTTSVAVANAKGVGALAMDRQGNLYGALRTERPGSVKPDKDSIVNAIAMLTPERRMIADKWTDGTRLTVRPNDLAADSYGGAYFTTSCLYYASSKGVTAIADNIRTNGIVFSPDDRILYVTNGAELVAFDVEGPGKLANRRHFAMLPAGDYGDGMAVDSAGRLYVSTNTGVQVFNSSGEYLGVIPTPRGIISVVFAGPDRRTLYVVGSGAENTSGEPIREGPQHTAATIYELPVVAQGLKDRAK
jgi:gluconolactonase